MNGEIDIPSSLPDEKLIRWLAWTGQLVWKGGRLQIWRRYRGSIYSAQALRRIKRVAKKIGAVLVQ